VSNQKQEPWEAMPHKWPSKSSYFSYLRGILRRGWNRHPVKTELMNEKRYKIPNPNPTGKRKEVWGHSCEICDYVGPVKEFQVDHIIGAGSLKDWSDVEGFTQRLLGCTKEDLRIVCIDCHSILTYQERYNLTFEEAKVEKQLIALRKLTIDELRSTLTNEGIEWDTKDKKKDLLHRYRQHLMETTNANGTV